MRYLAIALIVACSSPPAPVIPIPKDGSIDAARPDAAPIAIDAAMVQLDATPIVIMTRPVIYLSSQRARLRTMLDAKTPAATRYRAVVDRWMTSEVWGVQAWHAALLSQLSGDARYCAKAITVVETQVKAAELAIAGGGKPFVAGNSYLEVGDMIGDLALVYDWCFDVVSSTQRTRWISYANQAVHNVWDPKGATWGGKPFPWTGWATDNPSNNYHYSFLRATMLLGLATQDASLLDHFRAKMATLAGVFERDLTGGGSREGTGYGVAMRRLFEIYTWWAASTGEQLADRTAHTKASLLAMMHQIMPTLDRVVPIGDHTRDHTAALFDYHRHYLLELIGLFPTDPASAAARGLLATSSVPQMTQQFMMVYDFLHDGEGPLPIAPSAVGLTYHAAGIGGLYARSSWAKDATWIGLQAGPYTESHAHQDQGSILLYDGGWLAYDPVIQSKSGLTQTVTAHSLVRVETVKQSIGTTAKATIVHQGAGWTWLAVDATGVYKTSVKLAQRDVVFLHAGVVIVFDRVTATAPTTWQLLLPVKPTITATTAISGRLAVTRVIGGSWSIASLAAPEYTGGFRLETSSPDGTYLTVLSVDGAARVVSKAGLGVNITLADGRLIHVAFANTGNGGALTIGSVTTVVP